MKSAPAVLMKSSGAPARYAKPVRNGAASAASSAAVRPTKPSYVVMQGPPVARATLYVRRLGGETGSGVQDGYVNARCDGLAGPGLSGAEAPSPRALQVRAAAAQVRRAAICSSSNTRSCGSPALLTR